MNETAVLNDKFRKSTPSVLVFYPTDVDSLSPFLGKIDSFIQTIMNFEFPAGYEGEHDKINLMIMENKGCGVL